MLYEYYKNVFAIVLNLLKIAPKK